MIKNLDKKLSGELPISRRDLIKLISSWGRTDNFDLEEYNINLDACKPKECYPLENLDVSKITNLSFIFGASLYNGDISKWNVSNATNMENMFYKSKFNGDLSKWNVSNVTDMYSMFEDSEFNGNISSWNISNVITMEKMFCNSKFNNDSLKDWNVSNAKYIYGMFHNSQFAGDVSKWIFNNNIYCDSIFSENDNFKNKYNNGEKLPSKSQEIMEWFEKNRNKIASLNIPKEEIVEFDDYLNEFNINNTELSN